MHRFFIPPEWLMGDEVCFTGPLAHQIGRVLRMRPGEGVIFLDNSGWEYPAELVEVGRQVRARVTGRHLGLHEPHVKITLCQAILKGDRFEWVLQKGTEIGVVEFVPLLSDRCVAGNLESAKARFDRWQKILLEAAEQCGRSKMPQLRPVLLFAQACEQVGRESLRLFPYEGEREQTLRPLLHPPAGSRPFSVTLFIGPEGGWSPGEVIVARRYGLVPVSLGRRILRAETAGLVAATAILYDAGDLDAPPV